MISLDATKLTLNRTVPESSLYDLMDLTKQASTLGEKVKYWILEDLNSVRDFP